jgi:hypothetical protein
LTEDGLAEDRIEIACCHACGRKIPLQLNQAIAFQHQFPDQVDQLIELAGFDAQSGRSREACDFLLPHQGVADLDWRRQPLVDQHLSKPAGRQAGSLFGEQGFQSGRRDDVIVDQQVAQGGRTAALLSFFQFLQQRLKVVVLQPSLANVLQHDPQLVAGGEKSVHGAALHPDLAPPDGVENVLCVVAQPDDRLEPQKAGGAFDGVHCAENPVQPVGVLRQRLQRHHVLIHSLQQFLAFHQEVLNQPGVLREIVLGELVLRQLALRKIFGH